MEWCKRNIVTNNWIRDKVERGTRRVRMLRKTADAPGRQYGNKGPSRQTAAISGSQWNGHGEIVDPGRRWNEDDPPCKNGTAQGPRALETRQRRYCTENFKGTNVQEEMLEGPECKIGIKNQSTRRQLHLKIDRTSEEFDRKAFGLELVKRATGMSSRLRKMRNWILWRDRPPPKHKKNILAALT
jgi:hypothetical protein